MGFSKADVRRASLVVGIVAMPMLLGGCFAMQKDIEPIRSNISVLEKQFVELQQNEARTRRLVEERQAGSADAKDAVADLGARLSAVEKRLSRLESEAARGPAPQAPQPMAPEPVIIEPIEGAPQPAAPAPAPAKPESPRSDAAKPAPQGGSADEVYGMGMAYEAMGKTTEAAEAYKRVMDNYPYSEAAKKAQARLGGLK